MHVGERIGQLCEEQQEECELGSKRAIVDAVHCFQYTCSINEASHGHRQSSLYSAEESPEP